MPAAAEPVDPRPDAPGAGSGSVIRMSDRTTGRRGRKGRDPGIQGEPSPEQLMTERVEAVFNQRGRTLSDKATAETFGITLTVIEQLLHGAQVNGILNAEQYEQLQALVDGIKAVPKSL